MSREVFRILLLMLSLAAAPTWADQATVLKPATGAAVAHFKAWLKKQPKALVDESELQRADIYITDFNGDGKQDYVIAVVEGSGSYLYVYSYTVQPDGSFQPSPGSSAEGVLLDAQQAEDIGAHSYADPDTREKVLFTRLNGKTYMSFCTKCLGSRENYTWDGMARHPACDAAWIQHIRADFKRNYDHKGYEVANQILATLLAQCSSLLDEETRAWINNDLAITQYHLGEARQCLEYATRAKTSPKVASAAAYNEQLCSRAAKNLSTDFTWLLDASLGDMNKLIWPNRSRFDALLRAVVPNVNLGQDGDDLHDLVLEGLGGPPDAKRVTANRYVTSSACQAHACGFKVMLWVDVKEHLGLVAFNSSAPMNDKDPCQLTITSRMVGPDAIPAAFWPAFKKWRVQEDATEMARGCVEFIDSEGKTSRVTPPEAAPDGMVAPSKAGPPP